MAPAMTTAYIEALPSELLDSILASFPTPQLMKLATVSHRFQDLVTRLLYRRLLRAVSTPSYQLILECYHPSAKISTPYLHCDYLGTEGLDRKDHAAEAAGAAVEDGTPDKDHLQRLLTAYSRFRPVPQDDVRTRRLRAVRRVIPAFSPAAEEAAASGPLPDLDVDDCAPGIVPLAFHDVHLDEGELFSQLCTVTNLVRTGPRRGLFLSCVNISDGVIRVWRDWLADASVNGSSSGSKSKKKRTEAGAATNGAAADNVLWAYTGRDVGLRFRVVEQPAARQPLLSLAGEELPVSYRLEYEEVLVRTYQLLLAMEKAEVQEHSNSGKAVVIASM